MATRKRKRRLKKEVLLALISVAVLLMFVFVNTIKSVSSDNLGENTDTSVMVSNNNDKDSEKGEDKEIRPLELTDEELAPKKPVIVIDPAFGGEYAGSKGANGILQKDVNLDIALKVQKTLKRYNDIDVYLTRETDTTVSYEKRMDLIRNKKADVVISIQQNTEGTKTAEGVETYVLSKKDYPESDCNLGYIVQKAMTMYSSTKDRGVMSRNADILRDSYKNGTVGAIVYTGFITNEKESKNLTTDKYTERLGEGIAQGILSYVDRYILNEK